MGLRPADTDPDLVRSTPPPGDPAQLPDPSPVPGPPATKPTPSPPRARLLIDLRSDQVPEPSRYPVATPDHPGRFSGQQKVEVPQEAGHTPELAAAVAVDALPQLGATPLLPDEALESRERLTGDQPLDVPDEPHGRETDGGAKRAWPEIRFYLGAFSLFFVSYVLVTALLVAGATILLGMRPVAVTSGSMEPVIRAGDVVMFADPPNELLGPGTVVGFDEPGADRPVTHRVVRVNPDDTYITQGDANAQADSQPLERNRVWGVGRLLIPYAGYPAAWLAWGSGWKLGVLIGFLLGCGFACRWAVLDEYNPWSED